MRILYLNYEWDLRECSGAAAHIHELASGLRRLGHTVTVCARHRKPETRENAASTRPSAVASGRVRRALQRHLHEPHAIARSVRNVGEESALIRQHKPDIVLTRYSLYQFSSLIAARRHRIPLVFEVNAPAAYEYRRYMPQFTLLPKLAEVAELATLKRADGLFVVSSELKRYFVERGIDERKIRAIPNGADVQLFTPETADPSVRRSNADVIIAFVGSFSSFHGIEILKQVVPTVLSRNADARFLFVGEGTRSTELRDFCSARDLTSRVTFTGHVARERVPGLMAAADILVAPYAAENFFYFSPIKIFEYMATGRAVAAARIGQIAEVIDHDVNGVLYDPDRTDELTAVLLALASDPDRRARLGARARETIRREYSWDANAAKVAELLETVSRARSGNSVQMTLASAGRT